MYALIIHKNKKWNYLPRVSWGGHELELVFAQVFEKIIDLFTGILPNLEEKRNWKVNLTTVLWSCF